MKYLPGYLFLVITVFCSGCSPDPSDLPGPIPTRDSNLLRQFISFNNTFSPDTISIETFTYDEQKRLIRVTAIRQDPDGSTGVPPTIQKDTLDLIYYGNDQRISKAIKKSVTYFKNGSSLYTDPQSGFSKSTYTYGFRYNNDGKIVNDTTFYWPSGFTDYFRYLYVSPGEIKAYSKANVNWGERETIYTLNHQGENLIEQSENGDLKYRFSYDDKKSPFTGFQPYYPFFIPKVPFSALWPHKYSKNNLKSFTMYLHVGPPTYEVFTNTVNYSYVYRADGYPVSLTRSNGRSDDYNRAVFLYY